MGAVHIDKRRWERLDKDKWYIEVEDIDDAPTDGVPVLTHCKVLPKNKEYYFTSDGEWKEVGWDAETAAETTPAEGEGGEG